MERYDQLKTVWFGIWQYGCAKCFLMTSQWSGCIARAAAHKSSGTNMMGVQVAIPLEVRVHYSEEKNKNPEIALLRNACRSIHIFIIQACLSSPLHPHPPICPCAHLSCTLSVDTHISVPTLRGYVPPAESDLTHMPHPTCINIHLAAQWDTLHQWLTTLYRPPRQPHVSLRWHDETGAIQTKYRIEFFSI